MAAPNAWRVQVATAALRSYISSDYVPSRIQLAQYQYFQESHSERYISNDTSFSI